MCRLLNPTTSEKERRRLEQEAAGVSLRLDATKEVTAHMRIENKINEYIELFEKVRGRVGDDTLALAVAQEIGKSLRVEQMHAGRPPAPRDARDEQSATDRQRGMLRRLGVADHATPHLTKARASELIDEAMAKAAV